MFLVLDVYGLGTHTPAGDAFMQTVFSGLEGLHHGINSTGKGEEHTVPFWLTGLAVQPELTIPQAKCSPDIGRIYVIANDTDSAKRFPHACTQCPGRASTCLGEASRPRSLQQRYGRGACIPEYSCPGRFSTCLAASFRPGVHIPI